MAAHRSYVRSQVEPAACAGAFSTESDGLHYIWRGAGPRQTETTIAIYNVKTERWALQRTTGSPPPGLCEGGCAIIGNHMYCFGGDDGSSWYDDLHKLNLETFQWSKVHPKNGQLKGPIRKGSFNAIVLDERYLCYFGGYGFGSTCKSTFSVNSFFTDGRGWTNEFHLFDVQQDVWSTPQLKGDRPPPCSDFTFTKVDKDRAVLFGGKHPGQVIVNSLYLFNMRSLVVTKVEPVKGDPWPEERLYHAACCLNFGEEHPQLLVSGGVDKKYEQDFGGILGDIWIFDVDSRKWTEVTPPQRVKPRYYHSTTASGLGPGVTEVLMFGGRLEWQSDPVAETIVLRFERLPPVPTEKWAAMDVADNSTRGSHHRLRLKLEKTRETKHHSSSECDHSEALRCSQDLVKALEQRLRAAEQRVRDAEQRERVTQHQFKVTEQRAAQESQRKMEAEKRIQELNTETTRLQEDCQRMETRARLAEQRAERLEIQWVVHRREIQMTERKLGGGEWGVVKVAKFRGMQVAAKSLHEIIHSDYYRQLFIREMNMAARLRHPNLVQFIGATLEGEMIILTELMHTSLRKVLEQGDISREHTVSISVQVCQALNYLHLMQPDPVIHRDISSANILLNPLPNNGWLAKVTDYGSVNTVRALQTVNPGNPVYSAPEASIPPLQSTKMDIFSLGVLLIEMCTGQFPSGDVRLHLILTISDRRFSDLISRCIDQEKDNRPTAQILLSEFEHF